MMNQQMHWPNLGHPTSLSLPGGGAFYSERLAQTLRIAATTVEEREQEVERMVVAKVRECLTSRLQPATRKVWRDLEAAVAFHGLKITDFLSERTFYRRVAKERARLRDERRIRRLQRQRSNGGSGSSGTTPRPLLFDFPTNLP